MQSETARKRFTAGEYYKMAEVGILVDSVSTELLDGEVVEVSPMGMRHRSAVNCCSDLLIPFFKGKAQISVKLPGPSQ